MSGLYQLIGPRSAKQFIKAYRSPATVSTGDKTEPQNDGAATADLATLMDSLKQVPSQAHHIVVSFCFTWLNTG